MTNGRPKGASTGRLLLARLILSAGSDAVETSVNKPLSIRARRRRR